MRNFKILYRFIQPAGAVNISNGFRKGEFTTTADDVKHAHMQLAEDAQTRGILVSDLSVYATIEL